MQRPSVKDLSPQTFYPRITVRVSQIWENKNQSGKTYELAFIVVDQQGNTIEGCIPDDQMNQFKEQLKENLVYNISSFMVSVARKSYRAADHLYRIKIVRRTTITEVTPEPENFPLYAYDAKPFDALQSRIGDNIVLTDTVGVVCRVTEIFPPKRTEQPRRHVYIKDASGTQAIVTLWGECAENFDIDGIQQASLEDNVIILFVGMAVSQYSGMLAFKSTSLTRWYIDVPVPEINLLRETLNKEKTHVLVECQSTNNSRSDPTDTTLYALDKEDPQAIINKQFNLKIMVTNINNPYDWWFYSCPKCWKKMAPTGNSRRCPQCGGKEEQHRYKLSVNAVDTEPNPDNKEIVGEFAFLGNSGTAFTGKEAILLAATTKGRPNFIPPAIANLVGKQYNVTAEVKQETLNASEGVIILRVSKVQAINSSTEATTSSGNLGSAAINKQATLPQVPTNTENPLQTNKGSESTPAHIQPEDNPVLQNTPVDDVTGTVDPRAEDAQDTSPSAENKKRKTTASGTSTAKKRASGKGAAKELFPDV